MNQEDARARAHQDAIETLRLEAIALAKSMDSEPSVLLIHALAKNIAAEVGSAPREHLISGMMIAGQMLGKAGIEYHAINKKG